MSDVLKISGPLKVGTLSADPANPVEGYIYFNSTSGVFRMYENGSFRDVSAEQLEAHLNGGASKHDATEIDYERADGSKKNIQAASDDVETALTDLDDAIGTLNQGTNYTAADATAVGSHLDAIDDALATAGGTTFSDSDFRVQDNADATKQIALEASGITTATTRTITMPDSNVNLGDIATNTGNISTNTTDISNLQTALGAATEGAIDYSSNNYVTDATDPVTAIGALDAQVGTNATNISSKANDADVIKKDGSVAFTADQSMGNNKLTNLATPTADADAATKAYVDAVKQGLDIKDSVRVASTANISLTGGATLSVDGVALANGDRVLLKDQTTGSQNGIYDVSGIGSAYSLTRSSDANTSAEVTSGMFTFVSEGTANASSGWVLTTADPITLDTTSLSFAQFSGAGQITAGAALTKTGNTLDVAVDGQGIEIVADQLSIELDGSTLSKSASGIRVAVQTANRAMVTDGSGNITTSATTDTEVGHLSGVTSAIQTQIDGKLANVVEDTTPQLGGDLDVSGFAVEDPDADLVLAGQNSVKRAKQASKASFIEEEYIHSISLLASQTNTVISDLTFAHATYEGMEIVYKVKEATSNDIRIGTIRVVTNGTSVALNDVSTETADTGITFDAVVNGANINIRYSSGTNGATMRADVKKFLA